MKLWTIASRAVALGLLLALNMTAAAAETEEGFKPLFNGTNLDGWDGDPKFWSVQDGLVTGQTTDENPTPGNTFLIWRDGEVDDFELRLSYKIVNGNSGIQYRSTDHGKWVVGGYQADFEAGTTYSGINYEERGRGILAERGQKVTIGADGGKQVAADAKNTNDLQKVIKHEDWNDYQIIARGNHLTHIINGQVMSEVIDEQADKRKMSGVLALQLHAGPSMIVQFKDVRLKRLPLEGRKKIVLVAGRPSHGPGDHEFTAGCKILKRCLDETPGIQTAFHTQGWPKDVTAFDNADSILFYMDGGAGHPMIKAERLEELAQLMKRGVGLACAHYAVEVPAQQGGPELLAWIGGYYETGFSTNPHWVADFKELPEHPITRGVEPFKINDEWYFNMRFREGAVQPILAATPPDDKRGTPAAKEHPGRSEIVAWVTERPDGGRGFGFTGGHIHKNWGDDNFRKLVLNALLWTAKAEVPSDGVTSSVTAEELEQNLDPK